MSQFFKHATIVLPYDYSDEANATLDETLSMADDESHLHMIHVLVPTQMLSVEPGIIFDLGSEEERIAAAVQGMQERIPDRADRKIEFVAKIGDPGSEIVEYAREIAADLIVMPSHGRSGIRRLLLGSVAERVLRLADCPVLIIRRSRKE